MDSNQSQYEHGYKLGFVSGNDVSGVLSSNPGTQEGSVLFNDALNTFYLRLYGIRHMVKNHSDSERGNRCSNYIGYSFQLATRVLLYASSHRQDNT